MNLGGQWPNDVAFSPDGRLLTYGCDQAKLVYEMPDFERLSRLSRDAVRAVTISPDSQFLAETDIRGVIRVSATAQMQETARLSHTGSLSEVFRWLLFSADQQYLADAHAVGVRIWKFGGSPEKQLLTGHRDAIPYIDYSPDGRTIFTASKDQTIGKWNGETGESDGEIKFDAKVQSVKCCPAGRVLAVAQDGDGAAVRLVDAKTGSPIARLEHKLGSINALHWIDRGTVAAAGAGVAVWQFDAANRSAAEVTIQPVRTFAGTRCKGIAASVSGKFLAWCDSQNSEHRIRVWNHDEPSSEPVPLDGPTMLQGWHGLEFTPNEEHLFFVCSDGRGVRWNLTKSEVDKHFGDEGEFKAPHIALSPDGKRLAALHDSTTVSIWDTESGKQQYRFRPEMGAIWAIEWDPASARVILGLNDGGLIVWDLEAVEQRLIEFAPELAWEVQN